MITKLFPFIFCLLCSATFPGQVSKVMLESISYARTDTAASIADMPDVFTHDKEGSLIGGRIQKLTHDQWEDPYKRENVWGNPSIMIYPGKTPKRVSFYNPQWSPDGKSILFESTLDGKSSIYTMSSDGSNLKKITDTLLDYGQPCWSPDGKLIVYYGGIYPMQLFMNVTMGGAQRMIPTPGMDAYEPSLSSNGMIAFDSRPVRQVPNDISVIKSDGSELVKLTDERYDYSSPGWSADGKMILFARSIAIRKEWKDITPEEHKQMKDSAEIMIMKADGSNVRNLTNNSVQDLSPVWSRDGATIYYLSVADSGRALLSMNKNGSKPKLVVKLDYSIGSVSISPDGKYLAYSNVRENKSAIYILEIETRVEQKLIGG